MAAVEFAFRTDLSDDDGVTPKTREPQKTVQTFSGYVNTVYPHEGNEYKAVVCFRHEETTRTLAASQHRKGGSR